VAKRLSKEVEAVDFLKDTKKQMTEMLPLKLTADIQQHEHHNEYPQVPAK
jgi:hypothetical protein